MKKDNAGPDQITQSFLGHGYTTSRLPLDGFSELDNAVIELDNGDAILGWIWLWFNK